MPLFTRRPCAARPAFMAGGAVAGACAMLFGCGCPAPHGGIFLLPFIQQPIAWVGAIALGAAISTLVLFIKLTPVER